MMASKLTLLASSAQATNKNKEKSTDSTEIVDLVFLIKSKSYTWSSESRITKESTESVTRTFESQSESHVRHIQKTL